MESRIFLLLGLAVFLAGCTSNGTLDPDQLAQSIPQLQQFLEDNPNAQISGVLLSANAVANDPDFQAYCTGAEAGDYFKITITDDSKGLRSFSFVNQQQQVVCAHAEGDPGNCEPEIQCGPWGACIDGEEERTCTDTNSCNDPDNTITEKRSCGQTERFQKIFQKPLNSEPGQIGFNQITVYNSSLPPLVYQGSKQYTVNDDTTTVTMQEQIRFTADAEFDDTITNKALITTLGSGGLQYIVDLGAGIPATEDPHRGDYSNFRNDPQDSVQIPFFGEEWTVEEVSITSSPKKVILVKVSGNGHEYRDGEQITNLKGLNGGAYSATVRDGANVGGTVKSRLQLYDAQGNEVADDRFQEGLVDFYGINGERILRTVLIIDEIRAITTEDGETVYRPVIRTASDSVEIRDGKGFPFDVTKNQSEYDWTSNLKFSSDLNYLTQITIKNSSQNQKTGSQALRPGESFFLNPPGEKRDISFDVLGLQLPEFAGVTETKQQTKITIGDEKLRYEDLNGVNHTLPFYILLQSVSNGTQTSFDFDGQTVNVDVNLEENFELRPRRTVDERGYVTYPSFRYYFDGNIRFIQDTRYNPRILYQDKNFLPYLWQNTVKLKGAGGNFYDYSLLVDETSTDTTANIWLMLNRAFFNEGIIVFDGTDIDEDGAVDVGYYEPDSPLLPFDFNGGAGYNVYNYKIAQFAVNENGHSTPTDINLFIDTSAGTGDLITLPNTQVSTYARQIFYDQDQEGKVQFSVDENQSQYPSEAYTDYGTHIAAVDSVAVIKIPENRADFEVAVSIGENIPLPNFHFTCVNQACVAVDGPGDNECSSSSECVTITDHLIAGYSPTEVTVSVRENGVFEDIPITVSFKNQYNVPIENIHLSVENAATCHVGWLELREQDIAILNPGEDRDLTIFASAPNILQQTTTNSCKLRYRYNNPTNNHEESAFIFELFERFLYINAIIEPPTHLACVNEACVEVDGGGNNECAIDDDCLIVCGQDYAPVCTEDGNIYSNACEAGRAGEGVLQEIECTPQNDFCELIYEPVCGVDGITYENECDLLTENVLLENYGACAPVCTDSDGGNNLTETGTATRPPESGNLAPTQVVSEFDRLFTQTPTTPSQSPYGAVLTDRCNPFNGKLNEAICDSETNNPVYVNDPVGQVCPDNAPYCNVSRCDTTPSTCTDSDDGLNPFNAGGVTIGESYFNINDECFEKTNHEIEWGLLSKDAYEQLMENGEQIGIGKITCDSETCGLFEATCSNPFTHIPINLIQCENGCANGACLPAPACTDSDGGRNYGEVGETTNVQYGTIFHETWTDVCLKDNQGVLPGQEDILFEGYCDEDGIGRITGGTNAYHCPHGCDNGTCNPAPLTCAQADLTGDGIVDFGDFSIFAAEFRKSNCTAENNWCLEADFDKDGTVSQDDYDFFESCFNTFRDGLFIHLPFNSFPFTDTSIGSQNQVTLLENSLAQDRFTSNGGLNETGAVVFNGNDDYVNVNQTYQTDSDTRFNSGRDSSTVTSWVFVNNLDARQTFFSRLYGHQLYPRVTFFEDGRAFFQMKVDGVTKATSTGVGSIQPGTWQHVAMTIDTSNNNAVSLYVNGQKANAHPPTRFRGTITSGNNNLWFGKSLFADWTFDGKMDEVRVYNRALLPEEIKALYDVGKPETGTFQAPENINNQSIFSLISGFFGLNN